MSDLASFRHLFPVTERYAYLNHASTGPLPSSTAEAMRALIAQRERWEDADLESWDGRVEATRKLVATLLHATPEELAFVSSTSHGLNIVAAGCAWAPGDNVVCAETEFPANVYPWQNLRDRKSVV